MARVEHSASSVNSACRPISCVGGEGIRSTRSSAVPALSAASCRRIAPFRAAISGARLEAELVGERSSVLVILLRRLDLPAASVERQHLEAAEPLAQRMQCDECAHLGEHLGVPTELEVDREIFLLAFDPQVVEPPRLRCDEVGVASVGERRPSPDRVSPSEESACELRLPVAAVARPSARSRSNVAASRSSAPARRR